ncbi:MAG TPA: DmsC/YnfH family molybdoenzyme membrane anchor subunit [Acetobacteraceae bacterium]|nr:DmsC/YnfH family molybdoenzyme membrane anchor subunit [Acetobacteraceae bacterium]
MNPQFSVVFLTTASGVGYGMLAWLGVLNAARLLPGSPWFGIAGTLLGLALSAAGLLASTFHLGHPERAWRAVSQWRSSWLSREGVLSLFTNLPALGFAASWGIGGGSSVATVVLGLLTALCALLTVVSQAMIYASLKPVRQWHNGVVLPVFLLISLFSGAAWIAALGAFWNSSAARAAMVLALAGAVIALLVKVVYWRRIDDARTSTSIETATGLGALGPVRSLEAPHTQENYLLREMGFAIARKHAARLRRIALLVGFVIPAVLLLIGVAWSGAASVVVLVLAALIAPLGIYVERWLFFAEATHTVTLYYGRRAG